MPKRSITVNGRRWDVMPAGGTTQYDKDEFSLLFVSGSGDDKVVRVTRYSPQGARSRHESLAELSEAELVRLFEWSQPSATSPEAGYAR